MSLKQCSNQAKPRHTGEGPADEAVEGRAVDGRLWARGSRCGSPAFSNRFVTNFDMLSMP